MLYSYFILIYKMKEMICPLNYNVFKTLMMKSNKFYTEEDKPYPLSAYGKSKYYTEQLMLNQNYEKYWIFRKLQN